MAQQTSLGPSATPRPVPPTHSPKTPNITDTVEFYIPLLERPEYPELRERPEYPVLLKKP